MRSLSKLVVVTGFFCLQAHAEGGDGSAAVICGSSNQILDFYVASSPTQGKPFPLPSFVNEEEQTVFSKLIKTIDLYPAFRLEVEDAAKKIGPISSWISTPLKPVVDPMYRIPEGCHFEQAATRRNSTVYSDPDTLKLLSSSQRGFLLFQQSVQQAVHSGDEAREAAVKQLLRVVLEYAAVQEKDPQSSELPKLGEVMNDRLEILMGGRYLNQENEIAFLKILNAVDASDDESGQAWRLGNGHELQRPQIVQFLAEIEKFNDPKLIKWEKDLVDTYKGKLEDKLSAIDFKPVTRTEVVKDAPGTPKFD